MKKLFVCFGVALAIAAAAEKGRVTLYETSTVNGTSLKPGEYRIVVDNGKAILTQGKQRVEANVTVQPAESKFGSTSVRYATGDGKMNVSEIRLGGTNTKIVFEGVESGAAAGGGGQK
jgi:hypothetical protein